MNRGHFPNEIAAIKPLCLVAGDIERPRRPLPELATHYKEWLEAARHKI